MALRLSDEGMNELGIKDNSLESNTLGLSSKQGDYNSSEANQNPWDFQRQDKTVESVSISKAIDLNDFTAPVRETDSKAVTVCMYVLYVFVILQVASMLWISSKAPIDIYANLMKFQMFYSVCSFVMLLDVIIVQIFQGKKISLILLVIFFPFLYPWRRSKYTENGETVGLICTLGYIIAFVSVIVTMCNSISQYGMTMMEDDTTRKEVISLMNQVDDGGIQYGDLMKDCITIDTVVYTKENNVEGIVVMGTGTFAYEGNVFVNYLGSSIDTQLVFVKSDEGIYEIKKVVLGNVTLNEYGAKSYWRVVMY